MDIKCEIMPVTIVRVTINDEFITEVPFPSAAIEDEEYDYESDAIEIAKDSYEYHTKELELEQE